MLDEAPFAHVGGTLNNIDTLPGLHDRSRHELDSWATADKENRRLSSNRRGADHGDSLPSIPINKRRRRRNWESPASFEHEDAYDIDTDLSEGASAKRGREQRVICSFRIHDGNKAIRQALMTCICTCGETYDWIRRLGLPMNSIRSKLPYHRYASKIQASAGRQNAHAVTCMSVVQLCKTLLAVCMRMSPTLPITCMCITWLKGDVTGHNSLSPISASQAALLAHRLPIMASAAPLMCTSCSIQHVRDL